MINKINRGDIFVYDFGLDYSTNIECKKRPALIVSNNKGNTYGIPKPAGTLTKSATVTGVYQYKWGVGDLTNIIPLTEATSFEFTAPAEVASPTKKKHCFAIPEKYTVIRIELFNTLSNQWVNQSLSLFGTRESEMNKNPHISYTKYTRSDEAFNGESRYRITFTK